MLLNASCVMFLIDAPNVLTSRLPSIAFNSTRFLSASLRCAGSSLANLAPLLPRKPAVMPRSFCNSWTTLPILTDSPASASSFSISTLAAFFSTRLSSEKYMKPASGKSTINTSLVLNLMFPNGCMAFPKNNDDAWLIRVCIARSCRDAVGDVEDDHDSGFVAAGQAQPRFDARVDDGDSDTARIDSPLVIAGRRGC